MKFSYPGEFKDEEKWLKFLSTKAFVFEIVAFILGAIVFKYLDFIGLSYVGVVFLVMNMVIAFIVSSIAIPITWTLKGAGLTLDIIILRLLARRKNKILYLKNYER